METPNFDYIDKISGGNSDFKKRLIQIIKEEFPHEIKQYKTYINRFKFIKASGMVHKIKHKFSILGLEESYKLAIQYELDLRSNNNELESSFDEKLNEVVAFLENL